MYYSYNRIEAVLFFYFHPNLLPRPMPHTYSTDNFNLAIGKQIGLDMNMKILRDNSETHIKGEDIENCPI